MMLDSVCVFDVKEQILHDIIARQNQLGIRDEGDQRVRLIGQERDGAVIFCWDAVIPEQQDGPKRTHIGVYQPETRNNKLVFIHDRRVEIVNCTINEDHTFLGFVTLEVVNDLDSAGKRIKQDLYRAYLAEVSPQDRVFYLNIERTHYLMLQFLYNKASRQPYVRESHVLVFLHKESIGVYHLPISKVGDKVVMTGQPRKEQLFQRRYVWSQWDMHTQSLYVAHFRKVSKTADGRAVMESFLTCYQFTEKTAEFTVEIPIDLAAIHIKSTHRSHYLQRGPTKCIQESSMNMTVVSNDDGTFCLCCQHLNSSKSHNSASVDVTGDIQYTVYMVHHGEKLNCTVSHIPKELAEKGRLTFSLLDGCLLVLLRGHLVHLLNVSILTEPGQHFLYHGDVSVGAEVREGSEYYSHNLVPFIKPKSGCCLYDSDSGKAYRVQMNTAGMVELFAGASVMSTRSAILNYIIATHDIMAIKKLFEWLCNDISSPEVSQLMEDYLINSVFCDMKTAVDDEVLRLLPCSAVMPCTNQIDKNQNGERLAKITYSSMRRCHFAMKKWQTANQESSWSRLSEHVQLTSGGFVKRLSVIDIQHSLDQPAEEIHHDVKPRANSSSSLFSKFVSATKSAFSSVSSESPPEGSDDRVSSVRVDQRLGPLPPFLLDDQVATNSDKKFIESIQHCIRNHMNRFLQKSTVERSKKISETFSSAMISHSIQLCHILWHLLKPSGTVLHLSFPADDKEQQLLHMYERFILAASSQCFPLPSGFQTYITALGFKCLKFRMFIQYVDQGILSLTPDFVKQIFEELKDDEQGEQKKFQILNRLPQGESARFIQQWDHPVCSSFLVSQYITACFKEDQLEIRGKPARRRAQNRGRLRSSDESSQSFGTVSFPPLATLMKTLHKKDASLAEGRTQFGNFDMKPHFIEESALHNTLQQTKFSLNDISL